MTRDVDQIISFIRRQTGSTEVLENYVIPGLRSEALIEEPDSGAMMRLFEMTRDQEYFITPHDHRYNFRCMVLEGKVVNTVYRLVAAQGDYTHAMLPYEPVLRTLDHSRATFVRTESERRTYVTSDWYVMHHDEFHSITFDKGTRVLFLQEKDQKAQSSCLLPYVDGKILDTFIWRDWMMTEK